MIKAEVNFDFDSIVFCVVAGFTLIILLVLYNFAFFRRRMTFLPRKSLTLPILGSSNGHLKTVPAPVITPVIVSREEGRSKKLAKSVEREDPSAYFHAKKDIWVTTKDGEMLHGWFFPNPGATVLLIHFHGISGNISDYWQDFSHFWSLGFHVLAVDYRGYGLSTGFPTEQDLLLMLPPLLTSPNLNSVSLKTGLFCMGIPLEALLSPGSTCNLKTRFLVSLYRMVSRSCGMLSRSCRGYWHRLQNSHRLY